VLVPSGKLYPEITVAEVRSLKIAEDDLSRL